MVLMEYGLSMNCEIHMVSCNFSLILNETVFFAITTKHNLDIKSNTIYDSIHRDDGSCKHIVALMYAVANFIHRNEAETQQTSTSLPCAWNKPRTTSGPLQILHIDGRFVP